MTPDFRLASYAALLIVGELAGFACASGASLWPWAAAFVLVLALVVFGWDIRGTLPLFVLLVGFVIAARTEARRAEVVRHWSGGIAHAANLPVEGGVRVKHRAKGGWAISFMSHIGPVPLNAVMLRKELTRLPARGEVWRCTGTLPFSAEQTPGFSRLNFWILENADAHLVAPASVVAHGLAALTEACSARIGIGLDWCPELVAINRAMLLGRRSGLPPGRRQEFARAGTVHVFAISGLHVMFVAMLLMHALMALHVPIRLRGLAVAPVLVGYVMITGARPSAVRAVTMACLYLFAPAFGRKGNLLTSLSLTVIAVYGCSPALLFDIGCTLSFTVILGIVIWVRWLHPHLPAWAKGDWMDGIGISFAAWVSGVPIVAHEFALFTPGGIVANLAVLPLASLTVAFGMAGMAVGFVLPAAAVLFNCLAAAMTFLMVQVSAAVASIPFASIQVAPWPWTVCAMWYAGCVALAALAAWLLARRTGGVWWR